MPNAKHSSQLSFLTKFSSEIFQKDDYIGYDKSKSMIAMAKSCGTGEKSEERISFTDSLETVVEKVKNSSINSVLILSSVIHEVYSYGKKKDIAEFWNFVLNTGFDYVVVRDMCTTSDIDRPTPEDVFRFFSNNISDGRKKQIKEFEERWGSLKENKNFVHFILKCRWLQNWDRELNENYLSYNCDEFLSKMVSKFNIDYFERFRVPYLEKTILEEFKLKLADFTHIKGMFSTR